MRGKSVIKNGSLYVFGNLFNKAIAFITVPIFTRLLTTEEYGIVNTYTSWVNLLAVVVGLSLGNSVRNAYVDIQDKLGEYISSIYTLAIVNFGVICSLSLLFINKISLPNELIWFCLIESFFNFTINAVVYKFIMEEEAKKRTILMVCPNLVGAILSVVFISMMSNNRYYGRIVSTCITNAILGVAIIAYYLVKYKTFYNKKYWGYALAISLPLVLHGLSCNVLGTSDRTIITYYCGAAETGVYSLAYNLTSIMIVITSSAESVWVPKFFNYMKTEKYKSLNYTINLYLYFILFFYCGLLTFAPELILILGGPKYTSGIKVVLPIIAGSFLTVLYGIYVGVESYMKNTKIIAMSTIIAALLNVILNIIFVPKYGTIAAAYTTTVSYAVSLLLHSYQSRKMAPKVFPYKMWIGPIMIFIISAIITSIAQKYIFYRYGLMIGCGVIYIMLFLKYFKRIENQI